MGQQFWVKGCSKLCKEARLIPAWKELWPVPTLLCLLGSRHSSSLDWIGLISWRWAIIKWFVAEEQWYPWGTETPNKSFFLASQREIQFASKRATCKYLLTEIVPTRQQRHQLSCRQTCSRLSSTVKTLVIRICHWRRNTVVCRPQNVIYLNPWKVLLLNNTLKGINN